MTKTDHNPILIAKKAAGNAAAELIKDDMLVGLGTGSTAAYFIQALAKRCHEGLKISAVSSSNESTRQAQKLGIPLTDPDEIIYLDITVDGADEIDHNKNMIKGGGGALLREKLLAKSSKEMIVVVDETKLVDHLGTHPVPVEISKYLYRGTLNRLKEEGFNGTLRLTRENHPYVSDNGNFIVDVQIQSPILNPVLLHEKLKNIVGVIETGLFFNMAKKVVIGYEDGFVKVR